MAAYDKSKRPPPLESVTVDGTYVCQGSDGELQVTPAGRITSENADTEGFKVKVGKSRDISTTTAGNTTYIREVALVYPNGEVSTSFVVEGCILEYRDNVGVKKQYSARGRSWEGEYMGTYCSFGIPQSAFKIIEDRTNKSNDYDLNTGITRLGGYIWINAKLPTGIDKVRVTFRSHDGLKVIESLATLVTNLKSNIIGNATFTLRFKRSAENPTKASQQKWTVACTVYAFHLTDKTEISGPKLMRAPKPTVDDSVISDTLATALESLLFEDSATADVHEEEEEEDVYERSEKGSDEEEGSANEKVKSGKSPRSKVEHQSSSHPKKKKGKGKKKAKGDTSQHSEPESSTVGENFSDLGNDEQKGDPSEDHANEPSQ